MPKNSVVSNIDTILADQVSPNSYRLHIFLNERQYQEWSEITQQNLIQRRYAKGRPLISVDHRTESDADWMKIYSTNDFTKSKRSNENGELILHLIAEASTLFEGRRVPVELRIKSTVTGRVLTFKGQEPEVNDDWEIESWTFRSPETATVVIILND